MPNIRYFNALLANDVIQQIKNNAFKKKPSLLKEAFAINYLTGFNVEIHQKSDQKDLSSFNEAIPLSLLS